MDSTYYTLYDEFDVGQKVGVVVINRQRMKNKLFALYQLSLIHILKPGRHFSPAKSENMVEKFLVAVDKK